MTLHNKNVLITGASGGLGSALAIEYAREGCNLILSGRNYEKLREVREQILKTNSVQIDCFQADLDNEAAVYNLINKTKQKVKQVDVLINCAGIFPIQSITDMTLEKYRECININLTAPFILIKEFSKEMIENQWGQIINIASSSAYGGSPNTSIYCASKHALLGLSRSLHKELKSHNVRVLCVSPGSIQTEMGRDVEKLGQHYDTFIDPQELASYIVFNSRLDGHMISEEIRLNRRFIQ
jgi:3-oxoacyl-[acyl-carrier protein] reductase